MNSANLNSRSATRTAVCDPAAFLPLRGLISDGLQNLEELIEIERFLRTALLHDEMVMVPDPLDDDEAEDHIPDGWNSIARNRFTYPMFAWPDFDDCQFMRLEDNLFDNELGKLKLAQSLADYVRSTCSDERFQYGHATFINHVLGTVEKGGSALVSGHFGRNAVNIATNYPEKLFCELDSAWQAYAKELATDGVNFLVPPILGVVLTRCARRDAIPRVIEDLRDEWAPARRKVWDQLDALRNSKSLVEALDIKRNLSDSSKLFSLNQTEFDTRPLRIFWEILAGTAVGAGTALLAGGKPLIGAAVGTLAQLPRSIPSLAQDFGPALFGRGAFDLARRVRRDVSRVEILALAHLITPAERERLGLS